MIGIKVRITKKASQELSSDMFECISEPYVTFNQHNRPTSYIAVKDLKANEIKEVRVSRLAKNVTEQEYLNWSNE